MVDRVTAEASAKDLTGRPEGWHDTREVGAVARYLEDDHRPAHVFLRVCVPADTPTWADLVGFDPAETERRDSS